MPGLTSRDHVQQGGGTSPPFDFLHPTPQSQHQHTTTDILDMSAEIDQQDLNQNMMRGGSYSRFVPGVGLTGNDEDSSNNNNNNNGTGGSGSGSGVLNSNSNSTTGESHDHASSRGGGSSSSSSSSDKGGGETDTLEALMLGLGTTVSVSSLDTSSSTW
jgi:hypothetical protein